MADNVGYTPGSGALVAADEIGGVLYQRIKPGYGADGAFTEMDEKPATQATLAAIQTLLNGTINVSALSSALPAGAATETTLASALAALVSIAGDDTVENILRQLLQAAISPAGFDRSLGRGRVTALVESGTVTTVSTVTTVTTVSGLTNIDGRNGAMLINQTNLSAWADCVRARIT